jgi:hypothetical protein
MFSLPFDLKQIIADYATEYEFVEIIRSGDFNPAESEVSYSDYSGDHSGTKVVISMYDISSYRSFHSLLLENPHAIDWRGFIEICDNEEILRSHLDIFLKDEATVEGLLDKLARNTSEAAINVLVSIIDRLSDHDIATFCENPNAIHFLLKNKELIFWPSLCENPHPLAIKFLKSNLDKIHWGHIQLNKCIDVIQLFEDNIDRLPQDKWTGITKTWIEFIKRYPEKIDWNAVSHNMTPGGIEFLREHADKINWEWLVNNPMSIPIWRENPERIEYKVWKSFSTTLSAMSLLHDHYNDLTPTIQNSYDNHFTTILDIKQTDDEPSDEDIMSAIFKNTDRIVFEGVRWPENKKFCSHDESTLSSVYYKLKKKRPIF